MAENSPALIPEDVIVTDILPRLPVKSIGRFRCVSKPWRSLLSSPQLAKAHLKFHIHDPPQHAIFSTDHYRPENPVHVLNLATQTCTDIGTNGFYNQPFSCQGLVILSQGDNISGGYKKVLVNPITRESHEIPTFWSRAMLIDCSFGYDSLNDDFKIVSISEYEIPHEPAAMDIYSVKTKTWKKVSDFPYSQELSYLEGVFLNGSIHWLINETDSFVAAFSLAREEFDEFPPPKSNWHPFLVQYDAADVVVLGGCLALVMEDIDKSLEVWIMKEYGVQDSWTKFAISRPCGDTSRVPSFVCLLGDDEVLAVKDHRQLIVYSFRNRDWRDMASTGLSDDVHSSNVKFGWRVFRCMTSFSESLVSPNYK